MLAALLMVAAVLLCSGERGVEAASYARKYCGDGLTSALSLLCNHTYAGKRVDPEIHIEYLDYEEPLIAEHNGRELPSVFRQRRDALSMTNERMFRERRQGAASECCEKSCTVEELKGYCL